MRRRAARSSTCSRACTGWRARRRSARRRRSGPRCFAGKNARPPVSCASWRMTNSASRKPLRLGVGAAQRDRVDRRLGALRQVEHLVERDEARRVLAVREDDERLAPDVFFGHRLDLPQLLQRDVDGVVQRGRAAGGGLLDGGLELGLIAGEAPADLDAAVEVDDLRDVVRLQLADEVRRPPSAASSSLSSMLALLSSSSDSAIGCCRRD